MIDWSKPFTDELLWIIFVSFEILESISSSGKLEEGAEKSLTEVITELKKNFNS